jgi:hypothetical protein
MSPPDRPTFVNRNANRPDSLTTRKSAASATGSDTVHRSDDRDRALAHHPDHVAGHLGEPHQIARLHLDELADDFLDVATAAESLAFASDHEDSDVLVMRQLGEQIAQVGVTFERERVQLLRTI